MARENNTMGELIDLDQARRERWNEKIRRMRELGEVAVFGSIGEQNAVVIPFPRREAPEGEPGTHDTRGGRKW